MPSDSVSRLRDRIDRSDIVATVAFAGVLTVLGADVNVIAVVVSMAVIAPLAEAAFDEFDVDPGLAGIALGLFAVVAGIVQLQDSGRWFGSALLVAGCWICLDGCYTWRTDDSSDAGDDMTDDEFYLVSLHNRWLLEELRAADRPLTKAEICDRTGLTEADFERLLEIHGESSPIERIGDGYALDETETGLVPAVRSLVGSIVARLLRPVRLFRPDG